MVPALAQPKAATAYIHTEILIAAAPGIVWAVLAETAHYPEWNPFIRKLEGALVPGGRLTATIQPLGKRAMTFRPVVLCAEPGKELRWLGRLILPGLFDGEHLFRLSSEGRATRLIHDERFSGLLARLIDPETFRPGFEALNLALKARAEDRAEGGAENPVLS